jgi:hypothetical protein
MTPRSQEMTAITIVLDLWVLVVDAKFGLRRPCLSNVLVAKLHNATVKTPGPRGPKI